MRAVTTNRELRERRALILKEMEQLIDVAKTSGKGLDERKFNQLESEVKSCNERIKQIEEYPPPRGPIGELGENRTAVRREEDPEHRRAFNGYIRGGMADLPIEERQLLLERRDMSTGGSGAGIATSGGAVFVPVGFQNQIEDALKYFGPMLTGGPGFPRILDTSTGQILPYPCADDTANVGEMIAENQQVSTGDATLSSVNLGAFKFSSKLVKISIELTQDSAFDLEAWLAQEFARRIGRILNTKFTTGVGTTEPLGIVPAIVAGGNIVQAVGAGTNDGTSGINTIGSDDLTNLEHAVDPVYRPGARYMMNDSTLKALKKVKDKYGRPIWQESTRDGSPATINGYEYCINNDLDALQTQVGSPPVVKKTMVFGQLEKYVIRRVKQMSILRLSERFADFGQIAYLLFYRGDGNSIDIGHRALALLENTY